MSSGVCDPDRGFTDDLLDEVRIYDRLKRRAVLARLLYITVSYI
jgi:hypothetical protein